MASVRQFLEDTLNIKNEIVEKYIYFGEIAREQHFAALKIQRYWKGYRVRKLVKKWKAGAITIQRWVRGWLVRWHLPDFYKSFLDFYCINYYNSMATKIQAVYRGYQVRKTLCVSAFRAEREKVKMVNEQMRDEIKAMFTKFEKESPEYIEKCCENVMLILFERHHLLRTEIKEGVLSIHGSNEFSRLEKLLKSMPLTKYMKRLRKIYRKHANIEKIEEEIENRWKADKYNPIIKKLERSFEKGFVLNPRIEPKTFEKSLFYPENSLSNGVKKKICNVIKSPQDVKKQLIPYYINFWSDKMK